MSVDTLTLAQRLRAAELPAEHAEAIAAAIGSAVLEGAATKDDLLAVKAELKADISVVKADIAAARLEAKSDLGLAVAGLETKIEQVRTEIERSRNQIVVGFVSTQIAVVGAIIAAIKLL